MAKYKLKDCFLLIKNGAVIQQRKGAVGYPITRIETLSNGRFNRDRMGYADIFDITPYKDYVLDDCDILMSHINSREFLGRTVLYRKDNDETIIHGMNVLRIKTNPELLDAQYANYLFQTSYFKKLIDSIRKDAINQSSIAISDICGLELDIPTIKEQRQIAAALSTLDDKIALNRAINDNLEAIAKQLYDYWFVQFDFPNEEGKPYKSSGGKMIWNDKLKRQIPEGWHCGTLLDIAIYTNGLACQKFRPTDENKLPVIKIKEMHDGISPDTEFVKSDIPEAVKVYDGDVLFSWSASLEVMLWAYGDGGLNQHIFKVTSKNNYPRSFYFYQLIDYIGNFKRIAEARKTTMGHITQDHLKQSTIALPPNADIANKLEERLLPVFDALITNSQEIMNLTKQRDELLPLLMSGQVSVNYHLAEGKLLDCIKYIIFVEELRDIYGKI